MESLERAAPQSEGEISSFETGEQSLREEGQLISAEIISQSIGTLRQIEADPTSLIDQGGAAIVHRLPNGVCMKVLREFHGEKADPGNSLQVEAGFLERLSGKEYKGVRTPAYLSQIQGDNFAAILMEELDAVNVQKVLAKEAELPSTYSHHTFFGALEGYLQYMHESEGVAHGDLEARNIMIDRKTGMPRVVDFGRATTLTTLTKEKRVAFERNDWNVLEKVEAEVATKLARPKELTNA